MQFANIILRYPLKVIVTTFMCQVYLLLGGNLGDRIQHISTALNRIQQTVGEIKLQSSVYETKAWGVEQQPDFLNLALVVNTELSPVDVLNRTQQIEKELGRSRTEEERWGARTMDIDIIFYDDQIMETERLQIPHPLMSQRKFVLLPLFEISPDFIHPVVKQSIKTLYLSCSDRLAVEKLYTNLFNS
jgi:2-amino-4-hydroxy-6-hydroxymethyldihydropteridine diphosphokinase